MSAFDPACVKTRASRECAELFSPFSSLDCDCQCCSFPIQRNRDKSSACKFDIGVFTQPGPKAGIMSQFEFLFFFARSTTEISRIVAFAWLRSGRASLQWRQAQPWPQPHG